MGGVCSGFDRTDLPVLLLFPGASITAQPAEVIITDTREREFRISVDFITGSVSVEDQDDEDEE